MSASRLELLAGFGDVHSAGTRGGKGLQPTLPPRNLDGGP